jgi:hypothetical protein
MPPIQAITGARARFSINGVKVGFARSVNLNENVDYRPLETLDNIRIVEHVPVGYDCALTCEQFKIVDKTFKARGFFPKAGQDSSQHLLNILLQGELTATIEDVVTGKLLATVERCRVATTNYTINARDITGENVTFVAILVKDESEVDNVVPSSVA